MSDPFLRLHLGDLDDFWGRRLAEAPLHLSYQAFGYAVEVATNAGPILAAARIASQRYTRAPVSVGEAPILITLIRDPRRPMDPVPADFATRLRYLAIGPWLLIAGEPWLIAVADLDRRRVAGWISAPLAEAPMQVSRYIFDTTTLNMLIHTGIGQLHASCLVRDGRAVLLSAPHNTGKSTTAFRLVRQGYRLLSDGMTYVRPTDRGLELLGYPVGEAKLRLDVLEAFPELHGQGRQLLVREAKKMIYNLREGLPEQVQETSVTPDEIVLCLMRRHDQTATVAKEIDAAVALEGLWPDAAHYDDLTVLEGNLDALRQLCEKARCYELTIGSDEKLLLEAVDRL